MVTIENVRSDYPDVEYADSAEGTDGAVVATDWPEFDDLSFEGMSRTVVVDGRSIDVDESALEVYRRGRPSASGLDPEAIHEGLVW